MVLVLVLARHDVHSATFAVEDDLAVDQCEQRVILALADAFAGVELGTQLADDDVAGDYLLAAVAFDATSLTVGIATVAGRALTLLMCHDSPKVSYEKSLRRIALGAGKISGLIGVGQGAMPMRVQTLIVTFGSGDIYRGLKPTAWPRVPPRHGVIRASAARSSGIL